MSRTIAYRVVAALAVALAPAAVPAADPPKPADFAQKETNAADVELLTEAYRLADLAKTYQSPELYVAAGSLVMKLKVATNGAFGKVDGKFEVTDAAGKPVADAKIEPEEKETLDDIAGEFFERATILAADLKIGPQVEALVKASKAREYKTGTRGAAGGPKLIARVIGPGQTHTWAIPFDTLTPGAVGFRATGPCRCKMVTAGGITKFNEVAVLGKFVWQPRDAAGIKLFVITVHNSNPAPVTYKLVTN